MNVDLVQEVRVGKHNLRWALVSLMAWARVLLGLLLRGEFGKLARTHQDLAGKNSVHVGSFFFFSGMS